MKGKKLLLALASSLLLVGGTVSIAACGQQQEVPATSISLDQSELGLQEGQTAQLTATVLPENATDKSVTWSSSDEAVATVDANGKVSALKAGNAVITAAHGDLKATCNVKVVIVPEVEAVYIDIEDLNKEILVIDEEFENAVLLDTDIDTIGEAEGLEDYTVVSSDSTVVQIAEQSGYFFAIGLKPGTATLTIKSSFDATKTADLKVTVVNPYVRSVTLSSAGLYLVVGDEEFGTADLEANIVEFGDTGEEAEFESSTPAVATVSDKGVITAVAEGKSTITVTAGGKKASCEVTVAPADSAKPANGARSFKFSSASDRQTILGALEKYAVANKLTGLTMYGDGGYVMYNPDVTKPAASYVPGFGFGILSEGTINGDLAGETNAKWARYYHTYETSDPGSLNYMDDKGSVVGNLIGYVTSSYFDTFLNSAKDGYEWVNSLSQSETARPIPVNADAQTGLATKFKFPVKVGADLKYATLTENTALAAFNNREVELQDYITPYQIYYTKAYGLARSAENLTGSGSIKGSKDYYEKSGDGFNAEAWKNIGIKAYEEDGKAWLEFEFNAACSPFYAMYYLASGMYAPVPQSFIEALGGGADHLKEGVATWGKSSADGKLSPKDTWLSTGPYVVEQWDTDQQIVFTRNNNINDGKHYKIRGVHVNILAAAGSDPEAAFNEFIANKLHAVGIPSTKLDEYKTDPRATMTTDSSTYKLNLNTCDQDTWEQLFGVNGSITQTPTANYWECEPAMANKDFVSGLSFALNRVELATSLGRTPSGNYFGSAYMSDPEKGISYNSTKAHEDAVAELMDGTDGYGYNKEKAVAAFQKAAEDMVAQGLYNEGDTIEIEIAWQVTSQISTTHNPLKKYFEDAFNTENNPLRLEVKSWVGAEWSDVYYKKMMLGQFDIGFGSISGNPYDPLNFLEVLKSDNSSGFTLNWGLNTNAVDGSLVYDGEVYSFDALWTAADQGAYIEAGANAPLDFSYEGFKLSKTEAGDVVAQIDVREMDVDSGKIKTTFDTLVAYGYVLNATGDDLEYTEIKGTAAKAEDQTGVKEGYVRYIVTFSASDWAVWDKYTAAYAAQGYFGFDTYFKTEFFGVDAGSSYKESITVTKLP